MTISIPGRVAAGLLLAGAWLAAAGPAQALWFERPTREALNQFASEVDSVVVWSVVLPDTGQVGSAWGAEVLEKAHVRVAARVTKEWGERFARLLFSENAGTGWCDCELIRSARDSGEAVLPFVQFWVDGESMWVPISMRDRCARVYLMQGEWGRLPIDRRGDEVWSALREALAGDPYFAPEAPPPARPSQPPSRQRQVPPSHEDSLKIQLTDPKHTPRFGEFVYVEELPDAAKRVPPTYPEAARKAGVHGLVVVQALVGRDGRVQDARVVWSVPGLDAAALEAVRQWEFKPARAKGEPVAVWVAVPIKFSLH